MSSRRSFICGACAAAVAGLFAGPASAFRPSALWVLNKVADRARDRGTVSLRVDAQTTVWDLAGRATVEGAPERVWLSQHGKLRRELDVEGGALTEIRSDGKLVVRAPGKPDQTQKHGLDVIADIVTARDAGDLGGRLLNAVKALGINPEVVSFSRFDGRVAYLIGSKPWEQDKPQLWLDKDLLVPLRLVTFTKEGTQTVRLDLRYLGWGSPVGGNWYPQVTEIWRGEALIRRSVTENLERNLELDATLFDAR